MREPAGAQTRRGAKQLTLRHVEVIRAVVEAGTVTNAAVLLDITQPAVSMVLRECNEILGFPLFIREHGGLRPTSETLLLMPELQNMLDGMQRLGRIAQDIRESQTGFVSMGIVPLLSDSLLPRLTRTLLEAHERAQISALGIANEEVIRLVETGRVDIGLALSHHPSRTENVIDLFSTPLCFICHVDHPFADRDVIRPDDLADIPLITFNRSLPLGIILENAFQQASVKRQIAIEITHTSTAHELVKQQLGVSLVPRLSLIGADRSLLREIPFHPETSIIVQMWLPPRRRPSGMARRLIQILRKLPEELAREGVARI